METGLQYHSCCLCGEGNVLTLVFGGDYVCMRCIRDVMIPHIHLYKKFKKDQEHTLTADDNSYIPETGSSNCPSSSEEE